jgi:hypothetical protein
VKSKAAIQVKKDYIEVKPGDTDYWALLEAFGELIKLPAYPNKNVIWIFPDVPLKIAFDDVEKIGAVVTKPYTRLAKPNRRIALVTANGLQKALAKTYTKIVAGLSLEINVFSNFKKAKKWITEKSS